MPQAFDIIVLGIGGCGSAACAHLARRGVRVLGLEQFGPAHDRGSSHGETRIIRLAYFEHPDYVPLLRRSYQLWDELEKSRSTHLFRKSQLLLSGPAEGETIRGALRAALEHELTIEQLTADDVSRRFPGIIIPEDHAVILEPDAGFLHVERCVDAHITEAQAHGAELRFNTPVRSLVIEPNSVSVTTDDETFHAARLVVTAGAWTASLLTALQVPLVVSRKVLAWFSTHEPTYHVDAGMPCYFFELPEGLFYGFPSLDGQSMKIAQHSGVEPVADPSAVNRDISPDDILPLVGFARHALPGVSSTLLKHSICLYTLSPDHHFIVDTLPDAPHVSIACGLSGHGFKFASVLGEVLADLATEQRTDLPIEFLSLNRFSHC
ncbi:N-methyl-L-tryptophan oxidase [bacterium]|nr:N-methyl-L-tryptophan oxidase [bacterium]